jgi:hypothetical protein
MSASIRDVPHKVGVISTIVNKRGIEVKKQVGYQDVPYDKDGWADASLFLPREFDLVRLKTSTNKEVNGWLSTTMWDGLKLKKSDQVVGWKRMLKSEIFETDE